MAARLSRMERDALARRDAQILPLALGFRDLTVQAPAHLRHVVGLLKDRQVPSPCARAISHMDALYDRSIPPAVSVQTACRKGCAYCCAQPVLVYGPEAFFVAAQLRDRPETMAAVRDTAQRLEGKDPAARASKLWTRCPLLTDGACSVYEARPLGCRAFASLSVTACSTAFSLMGDGRVGSPQVYITNRDACRMMLLAALRLLGLKETGYELNAAVAMVLTQDNAEKRWLRGEDVFAGLTGVSPLTPDVDAAIGRLAEAVAPTL